MLVYKKYSNYENPKDFLPFPTKNNLAKDIEKNGMEVLEEDLMPYADRHCSIEVDGYTKRSRKIKAFLLCFPQYDGKSRVVRLKDIDNSLVSFSKTTAEILEFCKDLKLNVSTINSDGYGFSFFRHFLDILLNKFHNV